jgi:hypothetical protein
VEVVYPETFRRYKWGEIFKVYMTNVKESTPIWSYDFGVSYITDDQVAKILHKNGNLYELESRVISRSDYMYTIIQDITKLKTEKFEFYIEQVELPGVDYFFGRVLDVLKAHYIKPLTTYIVMHNTYLQCTESFSDGFSIPQAFRTYK